MDYEKFLEELCNAVQDEWEALQKYSKLLKYLKYIQEQYRINPIPYVDADDLQQLRMKIYNYMSEELKHASGLTESFKELAHVVEE